MLRLVAGVIAGVFVGVAASAYAARVLGSGTLSGWTVTWNGKEICSDPEVDSAVQRIECD